MTNKELIEKIRVEINRLVKVNKELKPREFTQGIAAGYADVLSILDTLSVEELLQGLDEAAEKYACVNYDCETETDAFYHHIQIIAFKAGAEWMAEQEARKEE